MRAWLTSLALRLRGVLRRGRLDEDFDDEMAFHLAMREEHLRAAGATDARTRARLQFGGATRIREELRDTWALAPRLASVFQDLRYAARMLRKNAGTSAAVLLTLSLGIGANTAVFSVVNAVLLEPLPYPGSERIVTLATSQRDQSFGGMSSQVALADFYDWKDQATVFDALAHYSGGNAAVAVGELTAYARFTRVSAGFFRVFELFPLVGRSFSPDEEMTGSPAVLVSHAFALSRFGRIEDVVGRTIRLTGEPRTILGVLPAGFDFPSGTDVWGLETVPPVERNRAGLNHLAIARLRPGATLEQARSQLDAIAGQLAAEHQQTNRNRGVIVTRLHDDMVGDVQLMLYLLLGAVALVLLIACANVATLLLARATARMQEMAVRTAMGATRARIARQMLIEGLLQGGLAGAGGLALAFAGVPLLIGLAPGDVPRLGEVAVDGRVLAFTTAISIAASLVFAFVPTWLAARLNVECTLQQGVNRTAGAGRAGRLREAFVLFQLALSVVLLVTSGLFVRSLVSLQNVPLGYEPENVLVMAATVPSSDPRAGGSLFFRDLLADVSSLPGVIAAGATMSPPGRVDSISTYWVDRLPPAEQFDLSVGAQAVNSVVAPGTFAALGIPVERGRDFDRRDTSEAPRVAIINESLAREAFRSADPLGRTIFCAFDSLEPMTIVGVVGNVRQAGPDQPAVPECYMPYLQHFYNGSTLRLVVRTAAEPAALMEMVRRRARELSPEVPVSFTTLDQELARHVAGPKFRLILVGLFALTALALTIVGVSGAMAYTASQRTREIGVRIALGATPRSVLWLLLGRGLAMTAAGLAMGLAGAAAATRLVESLLFGVETTDLPTYAGVAALLVLTSLIALYVPAHRATRLPPTIALRQE